MARTKLSQGLFRCLSANPLPVEIVTNNPDPGMLYSLNLKIMVLLGVMIEGGVPR
jgi:hypothetical protein